MANLCPTIQINGGKVRKKPGCNSMVCFIGILPRIRWQSVESSSPNTFLMGITFWLESKGLALCMGGLVGALVENEEESVPIGGLLAGWKISAM